jgi:ribosomal protein S18 acetylase RimI-like enzyme
MFTIRRLTQPDLPRLGKFWQEHWGAAFMVVHETIYYPHQLDGFVAETNGTWVGLITCVQHATQLEITSLDSLAEGQGIGSALVQAVIEAAQQHKATRIWLITTNDNLNALRFYQKRGFQLVAVHRGAVNRARQIKPSIPEFGYDGIPVRDEIELELVNM